MAVTAIALAILEATSLIFQLNNGLISNYDNQGISELSLRSSIGNQSQDNVNQYDNSDYSDQDDNNENDSHIKLFLESLDNLLKQDPDVISHFLSNHINEQSKHFSNRELPAQRIFESFTVKIRNIDLRGYFGASNGRVKTGEFSKPTVTVKNINNTVTISIESYAEDVEVAYERAFVSFMRKYLRGNVEITIPLILSKMKFDIGNHNASCVDVKLNELTASFSNPVARVYGIYYEDYVFSTWIQSALRYLETEINNQAIKFANVFLQKFSCKQP